MRYETDLQIYRNAWRKEELMTILTCECGNEIYIMDETEATAWQCDACGQWYDFFGVKVAPSEQNEPRISPHLINWSAGEDL